MTSEQVHTGQSAWRAVLPVGDTFAELFYGRLFALDPGLTKLFRDKMIEQGRNLSVAAANAGKIERIEVDVCTLQAKAAWQAAYAVHSSAMLEEITPRSPAPAP